MTDKDLEKANELTILEFEMLKYVKNLGYKYMARDLDREIYFYKYMPEKIDILWTAGDDKYLGLGFFDLFNFVKWEDEEPWRIDFILNNYRVKENGS